jgi:Galactosyltransferase
MVVRARATNRASVLLAFCLIGGMANYVVVRLSVDLIGVATSLSDCALLHSMNAPPPPPQPLAVSEASDRIRTMRTTRATITRTMTRVLVGYFSAGAVGFVKGERPFVRRQKHRNYFKLVNDSRICTLAQFVYGLPSSKNSTRNQDVDHGTSIQDSCQFIYTFVVALPGKGNTNAPTELLSDTDPIHNVQYYQERIARKVEDEDLTFLNIRENMNEGKSQTWFKYASQVMDQFDFDYVIKVDTDSLIVMDKFFDFVQNNLPPGGKRIYAGSLADKAFWSNSRYGVDGPATMKYMRLHNLRELYMEGQLYILSRDLAHWVSSKSFANESWFEHIEDHDVGMRIFDHAEPINAIRIFENQRFWIHPAKAQLTWNLFMDRESRKKKGQNLTQATDPALGKYFKRLMRVFETPK